MDSMIKESAVAELNEKPENFEISDPDDIDALLDSMADPEKVSKPITADDIIDPLDDMAADKLDENLDLSDPDDIDSLLGDIQGHENETSNQTNTRLENDDLSESEDENTALIENFTEEYVSPFLSVDFSELLNETDDGPAESVTESDDAKVNELISEESDNLSDDFDIDTLLAEVADSNNSSSNDLDIGDDILIDGQVNELEPEEVTDYTDSDVLADLFY